MMIFPHVYVYIPHNKVISYRVYITWDAHVYYITKDFSLDRAISIYSTYPVYTPCISSIALNEVQLGTHTYVRMYAVGVQACM